jgi:acetate---CoA ligase (ADP-forming)
MNTSLRANYRHADLTRLLNPASVAVIGASQRAGSFGERVLHNLQNYSGRFYPVNARYETIGEMKCYKSVADLPEAVDCAVICAAREAVEDIVLDCARAGVGGAIIFASGYSETGKDDRTAQQERLQSIARESGMRIVGPNCIGVVNTTSDARITFMDLAPKIEPGPRSIGIISQSGALGMALAQASSRGIAVSHVLTSGNSCDVDMADYVSFLAEEPDCAAIALVFEGMAEPQRLLRACDTAWAANKPLIIFKMASGEQGATAAMSHTGSLAGSHAAYKAAFKRAGAIVVDDYEHLMETASFLAKSPAPKARGVAVVATSGGAAIMAADRAEQHGVDLPQPSDEVRAILEQHVPEFGAVRNPCDVTAQVISNPASLAACANALLGSPDYAALIVPHPYAYLPSVGRIAVFDELARDNGKPICMGWLSEWMGGPGMLEIESARHVSLFRSMSNLFATMDAWMWREAKRQAPVAVARRFAPQTAKATAAKLIAASPNSTLTEREAKEVLALYGVPVVGEKLVHSADEAAAAAEALGLPVVLKVESPDLPHKTEAGVIRLNLKTTAEVRAAYDVVMANAHKVSPLPDINGVLVQPMVPQGVEMVVGARVDPLFGPLVVVGLGGILVELLADTALLPAPVNHAEALEMLRSLKGVKLLEGFRGMPATDLDRFAEIICRVSEFADDQRDVITELDVNPLICAGEHITAVDALIIRAWDAAPH